MVVNCYAMRCLITYQNLCKTAPLKTPKIGFQDQLTLNAGQKHCRMLQGEHSATLSTFIKLPFVFVLYIFDWPFYTGFTVHISSIFHGLVRN